MGSVLAAWCWLNSNSAAVTAVATLVIAWASWVSSRVVRLEKKIERANRMPVLVFVDEQTSDHRSLYVKNVGYGPALNVVRKLVNPGTQLLGTSAEPLIVGALAPAEKVYAYAATAPCTSSVPVLDDPLFHGVIECNDVLDGHYEFTYQGRTQSGPAALRKRKMSTDQARRI